MLNCCIADEIICWYAKSSAARSGACVAMIEANNVQASSQAEKSTIRRLGRPKLIVSWRLGPSPVAACSSTLSGVCDDRFSGKRSSNSTNSPLQILSRRRTGTEGRIPGTRTSSVPKRASVDREATADVGSVDVPGQVEPPLRAGLCKALTCACKDDSWSRTTARSTPVLLAGIVWLPRIEIGSYSWSSRSVEDAMLGLGE